MSKNSNARAAVASNAARSVRTIQWPAIAALITALGIAACRDIPSAPATTETSAALAVQADPGHVLVGAGSIAQCGSSRAEATADLLDGISGTVFTTGDNISGDGSSPDFANCYGASWGRHDGRTRPTVGDREYVTADASGYFGYFGAAAGEPGKGYYSYDIGDWHIVALNSEIATDSASAQMQWLMADLAASSKECVVGIWHEPRFSSSGTHVLSTVKPLWDALYAAGADVVLNGHYRVYERFAPQNPDGVADAEYGIRQFTVGTGGSGTSRFSSTQSNSEVRGKRGTYGVLSLTLGSGEYSWQFIPVAGQTFSDTGTTACHGAPAATPAPADSASPPPDTASPPADTVARPQNGGGSETYTTPNILDNASFEAGWDGFTDWSGASAPTDVTRASDFAHDGQYSVRRTWTGGSGEAGAQLVYSWANTDRIWFRFYFRLTQPITSIMKFARFYGGSTNFGGVFVESGSSILSWGWDQENSSITTGIGLSQAQVIDGQWHSLEVDYWRNGDPSGYPSAAFWFDGKPMALANGPEGVKYAGSGNRSYWSNGRLYAGERTNNEQMSWMEWLATLNAENSTTGQVNIDNISISTVGRIGS